MMNTSSTNLHEEPLLLWKVYPDDDSEDESYHENSATSNSDSSSDDEIEPNRLLLELKEEICSVDDQFNDTNDVEDDMEYWESEEKKQRWVENYESKNRWHMEKYGCAIDAECKPEMYREFCEIEKHRQSPMWYLSILLMAVAFGYQCFTLFQGWPERALVPTIYYTPRSLDAFRVYFEDSQYNTTMEMWHRCADVNLDQIQRMEDCNLLMHQENAFLACAARVVRGDVYAQLQQFQNAVQDYKMGLDMQVSGNATWFDHSLLLAKYKRTQWLYIFAQHGHAKLFRSVQEMVPEFLREDAKRWRHVLLGHATSAEDLAYVLFQQQYTCNMTVLAKATL